MSIFAAEIKNRNIRHKQDVESQPEGLLKWQPSNASQTWTSGLGRKSKMVLNTVLKFLFLGIVLYLIAQVRINLLKQMKQHNIDHMKDLLKFNGPLSEGLTWTSQAEQVPALESFDFEAPESELAEARKPSRVAIESTPTALTAGDASVMSKNASLQTGLEPDDGDNAISSKAEQDATPESSESDQTAKSSLSKTEKDKDQGTAEADMDGDSSLPKPKKNESQESSKHDADAKYESSQSDDSVASGSSSRQFKDKNDSESVSHSSSEDNRTETVVEVGKPDPAKMPIKEADDLGDVIDSDTTKRKMISSSNAPARERPIENESEHHLHLEDLAENLPDFIFVPFEEAVSTEVLHGWEDEWVSTGSYDVEKWGKLVESKIDFVYLWVNGSDQSFVDTKRPWEEKSVLNDAEGKWINSHGVNRYRDWDELRYSFRSIEANAEHFRNNIQVLVNSVGETKKQAPLWLNTEKTSENKVQVISQQEFFAEDKAACLPTFNSLTMENQIFNTPSEVDQLFTLSDDMLLSRTHSASDIHSPLFGPVMSFKTNGYNTVNPPTDLDAKRFGEKPFLIYTSWLLNRRFGNRKRKGQTHFGHSLSRRVMKEAIESFPGPELRSACKRFRGEPGFQLYSWYAAYHYLIERHREALLWSFIMMKSDVNGDGVLDWNERQQVIASLEAGMLNVPKGAFRKRQFYHLNSALETVGLQPPRVNTQVSWTSLDGPVTIKDAECSTFDINECLAPGFSSSTSKDEKRNPAFSSSLIFDRLARQSPKCGDCLIKILLSQETEGLGPLLPDPSSQKAAREMVVKALMRYRYSIVEPSEAMFVMVTDADQVDSTLVRPYVREGKHLPGAMCLNDDVTTEEPEELQDVKEAMKELYNGIFPSKSKFEL